ncbi:MAG: peptide-methionine (S)-S-oxide reductase [Spirochaetae bacterium HGW-Spirochaetae-4]|jgi:methionine-S-sulfoxide reductase|nr:MAG: peptide-methionine (S)-S-oxide reductase [Spirochaetae bacterium HGW-Spirochaetae-4]
MKFRIYLIAAVVAAFFVFSLVGAGQRESYTEEQPITNVPGSLSDFEGNPVAVFAGGCFWGVEYLFEQQPGVLDAVSGYTGGTMEFPTYRYVLTGKTGHVEAVAVWYDPKITNYRELAKFFFEIHDPTQTDGQGPDIGEQYLSVVFYGNDDEKAIAEELIMTLEDLGYDIATEVKPRDIFYRAEGYHQDYYETFGSTPYCHVYTKRFL